MGLVGLNIIGPVTEQTSYGLVTTHLAREASQLTKVSLIPLGITENIQGISPLLENGRFFDYSVPCVRIFHQFSMDLFCGKRIGFPIFELDKFTEQEKHHLRSLDGILVCSEWAKGIIEKEIGYDAKVVPLGTNFTAKPRFIQKPRFLHIGKVEIRKHSKEIVDAFAEEFRNEDVELVLSWHNTHHKGPNDQKEWDDYALRKLGNKVKLVPRIQYSQINELINECDAVISLSSAEGWNMPLLEGMGCGKWIIGTNCTGQTEFLHPDNSLLIDVTQMEIAFDDHFFKTGVGSWYKIGHEQTTQFKSHLRTIYERIMAGNTVNTPGLETARKFTWKNSAQLMLSHLENMIE